MPETVAETHLERKPSGHFTSKKSRAVPFLLFCILGAIVLGFSGLGWSRRPTPVKFPTPYQAILLSNGSVYYGKLESYGTPHPVLTNVFYILSSTNSETKQISNVLVRRGKELHGPDRMYLNPNQILFVETVGPNSRVAQLIAQNQP